MQAQGLSANENNPDATYNEFSLERYAMKVHGYAFSDEEDGSTDSSGGLSEFDEKHALLKPPPLKIDQDKVIVIKAKKSDTTRRKDPNVRGGKGRDVKSKKYAQKRQNDFNVSVNNFFGLLEESDKGENGEDSKIDSYHYDEAYLRKNIVSRRKKKRRKNQVKNENSTGHCIGNKCGCRHQKVPNETKHVRKDDDDENYLLTLEYFICRLPCYPWTNEALNTVKSLQIKIETQRTSWDDISKDLVHRSDRLLEQEYYDVMGLKMCSCCTGCEYRRTRALKNLSEITGVPCVAFFAKTFWAVLDSDTFLNVVGILIAALIYSRCTR